MSAALNGVARRIFAPAVAAALSGFTLTRKEQPTPISARAPLFLTTSAQIDLPEEDSKESGALAELIFQAKALLNSSITLEPTQRQAHCMDPDGKDARVFGTYFAEERQVALNRGDRTAAEMYNQEPTVDDARRWARRFRYVGSAFEERHLNAEARDTAHIQRLQTRGDVLDTQFDENARDFRRDLARRNFDAAVYQSNYAPQPPVHIMAERFHASQPRRRPSYPSRRSSGRSSDSSSMGRNVAFDVTSSYRRHRSGSVEHDKRSRTGRSLAELDASDRRRDDSDSPRDRRHRRRSSRGRRRR